MFFPAPEPDPDLLALLETAKSHTITPEERSAQRISFAYGNVALHNPAVTREMVEEQARLIGYKDNL